MEGKSRVLVVMAICVLVFLAQPVWATTYYVSASSGNDNNAGTSWALAKATVQAAITAASSGDQVWVKNGFYQEAITLKNGVELYGGFAGSETSVNQRPTFPREDPDDDDYNTVLDGNNSGTVIVVPSGYTSRFDGFTVQNGYNETENEAGGMICRYNSSMTIINNTFLDNVGHRGGGLSIFQSASSTVVSNNTFIGNDATFGGGIFVFASILVTNNTVKDSIGGSGIYTLSYGPTVIWNSITGNNDGGVVLESSGGLLAYNWISGNIGGKGAGVRCAYTGCTATVACNAIVNNSSDDWGGGIFCETCSPKIVNNTIAYNTCPYWSAAFYCWNVVSVELSNNIIVYNSYGICGDSSTLTCTNNDVYNPSGTNYIGLSDQTGINGNISSDPFFVDAVNLDYHLCSNSPCIDAGEDDEVDTGWVDMDGGDRKVDDPYVSSNDTVDIGAYEFAIIHVKTDGDDEDDGLSWGTAKETVNAALDAASSGYEIWVAAGTSYSISTSIPDGVRIYGGFDGTETSIDDRDWVTNLTVISSGSVSATASSYDITIDGFQFTGLSDIDLTGDVTFSHNVVTGCDNCNDSRIITCVGPVLFANNLVYNNYGDYREEYGTTVIYCASSQGDPSLTNNTIFSNGVDEYRTIECSGSPYLSNNIIANNLGSGIYDMVGTSVLSHNCVYGHGYGNYIGYPTHSTDINVNPLFVNSSSGNFHLQSTSPCIDAGEDDEVDSGWVDIDGEMRLVDTVFGGDKVDIGADEYADTTNPSTPVVTDDGDYTTSDSELHFTWTAATDAESGIASYWYAIGTTSGGTDTRDWTEVSGSTIEITATDLSLSTGSAYYISVKAENGQGLTGTAGVSDGIIVDATAPSTPVVTDGGACQSSLTSLAAEWASNDSQSGITEYKYAVGTSALDPGCGYLIAWTSTGTNTSLSLSNLSLRDGWTYYFYVKAKNGAGVWSDVGVSDGITSNDAYAIAGNGWVNMDLIRGWGDFEFSADTTWQWSDHSYGTKAKNDSYDAVAPCWTRHTSYDVCPDSGVDTAIYNIADGVGVNGTNCQYFALKNLQSGTNWGRIRLTVPINNDKPHALHTGDYFAFGAMLKMANFSGVCVTYSIGVDYSTGGSMQKVVSPDINFSAVELYDTNQGSPVYPQVPSGATWVNIYVEIRTQGDIGTSVPGIYVDDAYVYVFNRSNGQGYEKCLIPAPKNRNINRHLMFYQSSYNNYELASNYDAIMLGESQYTQALQIKACNPGVQCYCYEAGGGVYDHRVGGIDAWYSNCPIGFQYVLDNNYTTWLFPEGSGYATDDFGAYYVANGDADGYASEWATNVRDHLERFKFDGVFIDTMITRQADGGYPGLPPSYYQAFLHNVIPTLRQAGYTAVQNMGRVNLEEGYESDAPIPVDKYKEQGLIYFNPLWEPHGDYPSSVYENNNTSGSNTPDHYYHEAGFFQYWSQRNQYMNSYWDKCLVDMETVARWNNDRPQLPTKHMHMLADGYDRIDDPIRDLSDLVNDLNCWGHYVLCSYLLAQSANTTLQIALQTNYLPASIDLSVTNMLGDATETTPPVSGHFWSVPDSSKPLLRTRTYSNGIVVANGDATSSVQYNPSTVVYEEVTGTPYGPGQTNTYIIIPPRAGRIFFNASPY
ncbi:hypothetical protein LLG46_06910 [bacterium]|nr:hypothetical protein [bacterium]